ncbi:hypothetical protein WG66_007406 [Moniliophthora roreri]|nr:hypothetical protein WG66_007406 [Moniliophthora roreri]
MIADLIQITLPSEPSSSFHTSHCMQHVHRPPRQDRIFGSVIRNLGGCIEETRRVWLETYKAVSLNVVCCVPRTSSLLQRTIQGMEPIPTHIVDPPSF